jgi:photosystem II stability/assembly factor-like uncharacterized protein
MTARTLARRDARVQLGTFAIVLLAGTTLVAQFTLTDVSPTSSSLHAVNPNGASGGRVNGLARATATTYYAAGEWGGLYRTTDAGSTWSRLDAYLPVATWDVEVSPADPKRVFATSFFDGRVKSLAGIGVSLDGGATWSRPATATPSATGCTDAARREEPSAFGIGIDPANAQNVYIGTNCGLGISTDAGTTWRFVDPTPSTPADDIWDVVVHHSGIVDVCGDDGHLRSTDRGTTWTTASNLFSALPSGRCSIAASPDEAHVLFAVSGVRIFESDDGGATWANRYANRASQGRIPFVATNQRAGAGFDLWFGDVSLFRASCTTPSTPAPGGGDRCPPAEQWAGPFTRTAGGHDDVGDIAFAAAAAGADGCPVLYSSDGGVYVNTVTTSPGCHTPKWNQPKVTPRGLWLFGMDGADRSGATSEDLYFGAQDNGTFASRNAGATWTNRECCDGFDASASTSSILYTVCCFNPAPATRFFLRGPGMTGGGLLPTPPPGRLTGFRPLDVVDRFGPDDYIVATDAGVFVTTDITANPVVWTQLGAATSPASACGVRAAGPAATPTFYVQAGIEGCSGRRPDQVFRYTGLAAGNTWQPVRPPGNTGGFGVFAVDRANPARLAASHLRPSAVDMVFSTDSGQTWTVNAALNARMTASGAFRMQTRRGPTNFTGFNGYPQPTLVAFDPGDQNTIVAGAADAGVFLSIDRGQSWRAMTDNSGTPGNPIIPRPWFAYFDREGGATHIYVGTQGRGLWRIRAAPET